MTARIRPITVDFLLFFLTAFIKPFEFSGKYSSAGQADGYIYAIASEGSTGNVHYMMYPDPVDLTAFSKLNAYAYLKQNSSMGRGGLYVWSGANKQTVVASVGLSVSWNTASIDVSKLQGEYYIGFSGAPTYSSAWGNSYGGSVYAKNLWLEP